MLDARCQKTEDRPPTKMPAYAGTGISGARDRRQMAHARYCVFGEYFDEVLIDINSVDDYYYGQDVRS